MKRVPIEKRIIGGWDSDTAIQLVAPTDYVEARNMQNVNKADYNEDFDLQALNGNVKGFKLPSIEQSQKLITIYLKPSDDPGLMAAGDITRIDIYTQNGYLISSTTLNTATSVFMTDYAYFIEVDLQAVIPTATVTASTVINDTYSYKIEILFNQDIAEDFTIVSTPLSPNNITFDYYVTTEAIDQNTAGTPQSIGKNNPEDMEFIFASSAKYQVYPEFDITGFNLVADAAANSAVRALTSSNHGLETGDKVILSSGTIWYIYYIDPTTFAFWNSAVSQVGIDTGVTSKYVEYAGCIYYANRDLYGAWKETQYSTNPLAIKLICAKGLNLQTIHQIDSTVKRNNFKTVFKFTDYNNKPKLLNHVGEYTTNSFIYNPLTNPTGSYLYDTIDIESILIVSDVALHIAVSESIGTGDLPCMNYVYYARLVNDDFTATSYSYPSSPISIFEKDTTNNALTNFLEFTGNSQNDASNKAVQIQITGIPRGVFSYIQIARIGYSGLNTFSGVLFNKIPLNASQTTFSYLDDGNSANTSDLDSDTINTLYFSVDKAQNILDEDNRTVLSKLILSADPDLSAIAQAITFAVKRKTLETFPYLEITSTDAQFGGFQLDDNIINYTGYNLWDTVRMGIVFKFKGNIKTKAYWCKDVVIRDGLAASGFDYSLDNGARAPYSFYLEASNINWDYVIEGKRLRDLVDGAWLVRSEVQSDVIASGVSILTRASGGQNRPIYSIDFDTPDRDVVVFYSPDFNIFSGGAQYTWQAGDTLINLGQADYATTNNSSAEAKIDTFFGTLTDTPEEIEILDGVNLFSSGSTLVPLDGDAVTRQDYNNPDDRQVWYGCYAFKLDANITGVGAYTDKGVYNSILIRPGRGTYPTDTTLSTYIPINGVTFDIANDSSSTTYDIFGGDTFTLFTYLKLRPSYPPIGDARDMGVSIRFFSQSIRNIQLAKNIFPGNVDSATTPTAKIDAYTDNAYADEYNQGGYAPCFNIQNLINYIVGYDPANADQTEALATIIWSNQSFEDSQENSSRYFTILNQRALDLTDGAIEHMAKLNNVLYTLQPKRTMRQYFNNTNQLQAVDGVAQLGTGAVMGQIGEFKSTYGTQNKWAATTGTSDGGRDILFHVDPINRKLIRNGEDGTVCISDRGNIREWCYNNLNLANQQNTPAYNYGLHGGWDEKNKWWVLTSRVYKNVDGIWEDSVEYPIGWTLTNNQFYGFDGQPVIYVAKVSTPSSSGNMPGGSGNWRAVWTKIDSTNKAYYNWWTIAWSELENKFKWLITPKPKMWIPYKETILAQNPYFSILETTGELADAIIWEFTETGEECVWFCGEQTFDIGIASWDNDTHPILNGDLFDFIQNNWTDQEYSLVVGSQTIPITEVLIGDSGDSVLVLSEAALTQPTGATITLRICNSEDAFITPVINENKGVKVKFCGLQFNSLNAPFRIDMNTQSLETYLNAEDFTTMDEYFTAPIGSDTTSNPTDNEADTSMMFGKYLKTKINLKRREQQKIHKFVATVRGLSFNLK